MFIYLQFIKGRDSNSDFTALNDRIIREQWIGNNLEKKQPWSNLSY